MLCHHKILIRKFVNAYSCILKSLKTKVTIMRKEAVYHLLTPKGRYVYPWGRRRVKPAIAKIEWKPVSNLLSTAASCSELSKQQEAMDYVPRTMPCKREKCITGLSVSHKMWQQESVTTVQQTPRLIQWAVSSFVIAKATLLNWGHRLWCTQVLINR